MPSITSSFPEGQRYRPADLFIGQTLPTDSYILGKLTVLWTVTDTDEDLRFRISATYSSDDSNNDYIAAQQGASEKWRFIIRLTPSATSLRPGQTARQAVEAEHEGLSSHVSYQVKISTDGLRVGVVDGKDVTLYGSGSKMMWTEKRGKWTLFQDTTQSSNTPSWLKSDSSLPSPAGPPARIAPQAGPSNYRPITSHLPPQLNLRATNSPTKRKRTQSPGKHSQAPPPKQAPPVFNKKVVDLGPGNHATFTRLTSGFNDLAILRGSSSIGDALASSSSSFPDPIPHTSFRLPSPVKESAHTNLIPTDGASPPAQKEPTPAASPQMPAVRQARPTGPVVTTRAELEAAARLQGLKKLEQQQAEQRAEQEAAAVLGRGLQLADVIYTPMNQLQVRKHHNIIGVVIDVKPINPPSGARLDPLLSIVVTDPSINKGEGADAEDLVVSIFRKHAADLCTDLRRGTPIIFRGVKAGVYNGKIKGNIFSNDGSWASLLGDKIVYGKGGASLTLQKAEIDRLTEIGQWWKKTTGETQDHVGPRQSVTPVTSGGRKMALLSEVGANMFFDAAFKIIDVRRGPSHFEVYVTDGSVSPTIPRNFHGVAKDGVPQNAIFCIQVSNVTHDDEMRLYQEGNVIRLRNLRSKIYKGELELSWSNLVTEEQERQGWKNKRSCLLAKDDPESVGVEERLAGCRSGTGYQGSPQRTYDDESQYTRTRPEIKFSTTDIGLVAPPAPTSNHVMQVALSSVIPPAVVTAPPDHVDVPTATHVYTAFTDPIENPSSTMAEVLSNRTFPNKFRVRARVREVRPRGMPGNADFVQKHCGKCKKAKPKPKTVHCGSCQDVHMKNASWIYRFVAILEDENSILPILISDKEAEQFLPSLPPVSSSTNPNDHKKTERRIADITKNVINVLQGATMDGVRPRPWIDWTLQSVVVAAPKGHVGLKGEKGIVVYRAFGMTCP